MVLCIQPKIVFSEKVLIIRPRYLREKIVFTP
jgi:hypothetical protein